MATTGEYADDPNGDSAYIEKPPSTCLFIGGPADGERLVVPSTTRHYTYPYTKDGLVYRALYRPQKFSGNSRTYIVYVETDVTLGEALKLLLDGYHR